MSSHAVVPANPVAAKARIPSRAPSSLLQRKCECGGSAGFESDCEDCKKKKPQRRAVAPGPAASPPIVHEVLRSPGRPLDPEARAFFEPRFHHDFSKVRVHTDEKAARSARDVHALAYTVGSSVVFAAGQYLPSTQAGQRLLAHELAHVIQQSESSQAIATNSIAMDFAPDPLEAEAERASAAILTPANAHGKNPAAAIASRGLLQRASADPAPASPAPRGPTAEFSGCDQSLQDDLQAKQAPALDHVNGAISALSKGWKEMHPADQATFQHFFDPAESGEIDESFVKDVRGNYQLIRSYMNSLSFDCDPSSGSICGGPSKWCKKNLMWTCFGALHVCQDSYRSASDDDKMETMIHESTHNALHTTDREYSNDPKFNRLKPRGSVFWQILRNIPVLGLLFRLIPAANDTLYNPDSYAGFAMETNKSA
jgi:Domain of unknown function (DUF4157)